MVVNASLAVVKLVAGWMGASSALVADGLHSLSDLASDGLVLWGASVASRPEDVDHPYGHGRVETLAGGLVGLFLLGTAVVIGWRSVKALFEVLPSEPYWWVLAVAAGSFVFKEGLFRLTIAAGQAEKSLAALANAWHHRSDALSSLAVMVGVVVAKMGWPGADPMAALAVACLIGWMGGQLSLEAGQQLVDRAVDQTIVSKIQSAAESTEGVLAAHAVRARSMGARILVDLHIVVDGSMTVEAGHSIAEQVESAIQAEVPRVAHVIVHVDPWTEVRGQAHGS
jgi:cation diffusion facilitator family transporter